MLSADSSAQRRHLSSASIKKLQVHGKDRQFGAVGGRLSAYRICATRGFTSQVATRTQTSWPFDSN